MFVVVPLAVLLAAYLWHSLPTDIRDLMPEGWEAALLIPVVALTISLRWRRARCWNTSVFDGDMPLDAMQMGIGFDQRNALIIGMAMGFAVIPSIFSIAEDAIFTVRSTLPMVPWRWATPPGRRWPGSVADSQPRTFLGHDDGLGRAVGETMIVLMATGNTPVTDLNIFEGMRTLSANIAVELPESEVTSTHYRILFLAALVLFLFTFLFNTAAELISQRLRKKYTISRFVMNLVSKAGGKAVHPGSG